MYEVIFKKYEPKKDNLIYILHDIQDSDPQQYLSEEAVRNVSDYLKIPVNHIYGVIGFYTMFSTVPRGKYIIRLCESPPCFLKGSENILNVLKKTLKIKTGQTTKDKMFTLELSSCLGVCGNAPVMMINEDVFGDLNEEKVKQIITKLQEESNEVI